MSFRTEAEKLAERLAELEAAHRATTAAVGAIGGQILQAVDSIVPFDLAGAEPALPPGTRVLCQAGFVTGLAFSGGTATLTFPVPFPTGVISVLLLGSGSAVLLSHVSHTAADVTVGAWDTITNANVTGTQDIYFTAFGR